MIGFTNQKPHINITTLKRYCYQFACLLISLPLLVACHRTQPVDSLDIKQMKQWSYNTVKPAGGNISSIRLQAIQETALSVGARSGLAHRSNQLNAILLKDAKTLDRAFNFVPLMLEHNVAPPILVEGLDTMNLADDMSIRIADRSYTIMQQARFVTAAPNWRSYLWMGFDKPEAPDRSLLPRDRSEDKVWRCFIEIGWKKGIKQANIIYSENLNRLRRDYQGMLMYRRLLAQNMVSTPFVAKVDLGITTENNSMRINDQVLRITALPQLQGNGTTWNPVLVKEWHPQSKPTDY